MSISQGIREEIIWAWGRTHKKKKKSEETILITPTRPGIFMFPMASTEKLCNAWNIKLSAQTVLP